MHITDMIDEPVSTQKYTIYDIESLPKVLLCINVKSKYDEIRLQIKSKYKPKYICHFQNINKELQPLYYYGIELNLKDEYMSMINNIKKHVNPNLDMYCHSLARYSLSCTTCYGYFTDSVWPIDLQFLQKITKTDYIDDIESGFANMLTRPKKTDPVYKRVINFNILILSKSIEYDN